MKKSSIFILLVSFFLSIFLISFFGLAVSDEHMKRYFTKAEFINTEVAEFGGNKLKYINIEINSEDGLGYFYITYGEYYQVLPEDSTDSNGYEFVIISDIPTYIDDNGDEQPTIEIYKEKITFYTEGSATVMLRTTDGSDLHDTLLIVCSNSTAI